MTGFGFNAPASTSFGFGMNTQTTSSPFGFGGTTTSTAAPSFGFGAPTSAGPASTPSFGFGTATTSATPSFGFGSSTCTTPAFGFGSSTAPVTQSQSIFSGLGQSQPVASIAPSFGGFGASFGAKPFGTTTSSFSLGQPNAATQGISNQLLQQHQQPTSNTNDIVINSIVNCKLFGDERDQIICKLNLLQACWGTGKGYYALNNTPPVDYTPQNPLCRFKAITYSVKPTSSSRDALVTIVINKKMDDIRKQEVQLTSNLFAIFGSKPNLSVHLDTLKWYTEKKSMALIYVEEKLENGHTKRITNNDVVNYLMQPSPKQQLTSMGVENVFPYAGFTDENLRDYYEQPPAGIDLRVWKQAQADNPNSAMFIPVPIVGFSELSWKYKCHSEQVNVHKLALNSISERLSELARKKTRVESKLEQYMDKMDQLTHRIVKVLVGQMVILNAGMALRPEEETIKNQLEVLYNDINSPLRFQGKLTEIATLVRLKNSELSEDSKNNTGYIPQVAEEIKNFLELQQRMITEMQTVVTEDINSINLMKETLSNVK